MENRLRLCVVSLAAVVPFMTGCAHVNQSAISASGPGFFSGLWHGAVAPFSFIAYFWDYSIAIYAVPNNGGWYNFGYLIGLYLLWGGIKHGVRAVRSKEQIDVDLRRQAR